MDTALAMILLSLGVAGASAVTYIVVDRRCRAKIHEAQTAAALAEQRVAGIAAQLESAQQQHVSLNQQHEATRAELVSAKEKLASATAQLEAGEKNLAAQRELLNQANEQLSKAFAQISNEALEKSTASFLQIAETRFKTLSTEAAGSLEQRKTAIEGLLKPLQETLTAYQVRLAEVEKNRNESYSGLQKQIGQMTEIERTLAQQTHSLVNALTRPHVRGQWGELTLRKLVELAGLTEHCDFEQQVSIGDTGDDAARLRPDMVIRLPGDRNIIIDAKAVLSAFLEASAAQDEATKKDWLKKHSEYVRARVKDLSNKAYWSKLPNAPELVVLFLPGEAFLYAAVEFDATLLEDCMRNKVTLATPTTLIALLKTVECGWRQKKLDQNAEEICKLGGTIYERLAVVTDSLISLGSSLNASVNSYNTAVGSLESRLLVSARKMAELGAKSEKKTLPETMPPVESRPRKIASELYPDKSPLLPE